MQPEKSAVIAISIIQTVFYALFLLYYVLRIIKLEKMASNNIQNKPRKYICILMLLGILGVLNVIHIFLSFFESSYWLHSYDNFSLISLIVILNLVLQFYVIITEYKKNSHRTIVIITQWIFMAAIDLIQIILISIYNPSSSISLTVAKFIIEVILVVLSINIHQHQPKKQMQINNLNNVSHLLPLMQTLSENRSQDHIYIEFNKQFDVTYNNDETVLCMFKIAVYIGNNSYIILKNDSNFIDLRKEMLKYFPTDTYLLQYQNLEKDRNPQKKSLMKFGQERQKICQNLLIQLTRTNKYYSQSLLNFLEVPDNKRQNLIEIKAINNKEYIQESSQHIPNTSFFNVDLQNGKICVSNEDLLVLYIDKTNNQIIGFHDRLLATNKIKSSMIQPQSSLIQIVGFISKSCNSKSLWRYFAQWLCLGVSIEDKVYNMFDFWYSGFKKYSFCIIGHQIAFDKQGSIVTLYLLKITKKKSTEDINIQQGRTIKKRFNQFSKLDKQLRKYMNTHNIKGILPALPPKFSPFGSKTSPKSRQVYFDNYIKEVVKIQRINQSIKFLQFLEIDSDHSVDNHLTERTLRDKTEDEPSFMYEKQMQQIGSHLQSNN